MILEKRLNPLISIIVPIYNVKDYLDICIKSLVEQSYKNLDIILIDDGSTDQSGVICDEWARKDERIYVVHTINYGVSTARNIGIRLAKGDYIGFVDGDDWVDNDTYECLLSEILKNDADVSGGGYIKEYVSESVIPFKREKTMVYSRERILQEIFTLEKPKILFWEVCDKLFKAELIKGYNFDISVGASEDKLFFWECMINAKKFSYAPLYKYHYRMRKDSATHGKISEKTISELKANRKINDLAKKENDSLKKVIMFDYLSSLLSTTRQMIVYDPLVYKKEIIKSQKEVRDNWYKYLLMPRISIRIIGAVVFLSMPFWVCEKLSFLVRKSSD